MISLAKNKCSEIYKDTIENIRLEEYYPDEQTYYVTLSFSAKDSRIYKRFLFDAKTKEFVKMLNFFL